MGMIPIGDDDSGRTVTPLVNYLLIAANVAVFVLLQEWGQTTGSPTPSRRSPRRSSAGRTW